MGAWIADPHYNLFSTWSVKCVFFNFNVPLNYLMCPVFTVGPLPETVVEAVEKVAAPFFEFFFPLEQNW